MLPSIFEIFPIPTKQTVKSDSSIAYTPSEEIAYRKEYSLNFLDWIMLRGQFVTAIASATGTLYTVPKGYTLYVTHVSLSCVSTVASVQGCSISIFNPSAVGAILVNNQVQNNSSNIALSFPVPITVNENYYLRAFGAGSAFSVAFSGYLIPKL